MGAFSVVRMSQLEGALRLDAEYYKPEYLTIRDKLNSISTKEIKDISVSVVNFGAYSLCNYITFQKEGIPYLNVENIREGYIDWVGIKYIDPLVHKLLWKSKVRENQVILTMAGTIGNAAVAYKIPSEINSNQATAKITLQNDFSPFYLAVFLNSFYGRIQTKWEIVSNVQPNIFLWQIKRIKVFVPKIYELIEKIDNLYKNGLDLLNDSKVVYSQAENLLLEELGLKDFEPKNEKTYTANLSDAFFAHRIDAEYFQPAYEEVIRKIEDITELKPLGKLANRVRLKINPENNKLYRYIEISDVLIDIGEVNYTERLGKDLPPNARIPVKGGELIISKVRPTRGAIGIIPYCLGENLICSSAFSVFNVSSPLKEYLYVITRSIIGRLQLEKPTKGTSYPTIEDLDVEKLRIPLLPLSTQQKIASLVQQSHDARKKAIALLDEAKRRVEEEIENQAAL